MNDTGPQSLPSLLAARELRECAGCGTRFIGWSWHTHCHACYRYIKPGPDASQHDPETETRLLKIELEMIRLELAQERKAYLEIADQLAVLERASMDLKTERDLWMERYFKALAARSSRRPMIPPGILRRLLWLCHPDRHGDSEAANTATAWLLSQRKR
ncbi:MAG TPA: hypothetical protein P5149_03190 [Candidatus Competibacteraceae bacterium]|nr:hypothetical protein [Candidatus Competibacteraceae bacterium]MCP5134404.1 hypothetical protein [Gammaproteobacteria bacterium]HPF57814.1 hypothetical protein [Candidatus Competibacteraceae bacterium]HRY17384.1 hypothetical protein [Candidatus Competibacteraceae bacterium]